jgi:competence protein ComEC
MKRATRTEMFPMLILTATLMAGIIVGNIFIEEVTAMTWLLFLLILFILCVVSRNQTRSAIIFFFFFTLGGFLISNQNCSQQAEWPSHPIESEAVIVSPPIVKDKVVECDMKLISIGRARPSSNIPLIKAFLIKDKRSESLAVGDGMTVYSKISKPYNRGKTNFDYAKYLTNHGFTGTTFIDSYHWKKQAVDISQLTLTERTKMRLMRFRSSCLHQYQSLGFTNQQYAVMAALTLGDKSSLSKSTKESYSRAGASHVLALSGLHLGILYNILLLLFGGRKHRYASAVIIILSVWTFVLFVGMSPSVIRSAVMLTIYLFVSLLHRDNMSVNTLALAAFIMLLTNPQNFFDVGFELSFVAVLSILLFYQPLYELFNPAWMMNHRIIRYFTQIVAVSVAAQTGTFPLVIYYFGRFPVYFLLTNLVVILLATVILYLSVIIFITFFIPVVQELIASFVVWLVSCMNSVMMTINHLPLSSIEHLSPSILQVFLMYMTIFTLYLFFIRHTPQRLKLSLVSILVLLMTYLLPPL